MPPTPNPSDQCGISGIVNVYTRLFSKCFEIHEFYNMITILLIRQLYFLRKEQDRQRERMLYKSMAMGGNSWTTEVREW